MVGAESGVDGLAAADADAKDEAGAEFCVCEPAAKAAASSDANDEAGAASGITGPAAAAAGGVKEASVAESGWAAADV